MIETTGPGGAETVLLNIVRRLDSEEFDSLVVVLGKGWLHDQLVRSGVKVRVLPSSRANDWLFLWNIRQLVKAERVELIHSHLDGMNFYACLAGQLTGRPVVATFHGMIGEWHGLSIKSRLKFAIIRRYAKRVVAVSNYLKRELEQKWRFSPDQITMIHNGVDFDEFETMPTGRSIRDDLGFAPNAPLIGMVGNVRRPKGYRYFVSAARLVIDKIPECRFLIVGHGEGKLLNELIGQIEALGLTDKVVLTGFREDVASVVAQLDIFMLSSLTEGLSIATIEAMGLGKPVVVTDSGGPGEIVRNGETGYVVRPGDPRALADRTMQLLLNRGLADRMGQAGREDVRHRFGLDQSVRAYEQLYRNCE